MAATVAAAEPFHEDTVGHVESALASALGEVCPSHTRLAMGSVQKYSHRDSAEFSSKVCSKLFWTLFKQQRHGGVVLNSQGEKVVRLVSDYSLEKEVTLPHLNKLIFAALPNDQIQQYFSFVGISHDQSLTILFTSKRHASEQARKGLVGCPRCGKFVRSENSGLEWHLKNVHQITEHASAYDVVASAKNSLSLYTAVVPGFGGDITVPGTTKVLTKLERYADMTVAQNDPSLLQQMIEEGRVKRLCHPGLDACRCGDLSTLRHYVEKEGWNPIQCRDRNGSSGMLWAAGGGHLECLKYLIVHCGMDPRCEQQRGRRGYAGRTVLHWAARNGHLECVRHLLEACKMAVDAPSEDGTTPFHLAVWQNHIGVCHYLVQQGACPELCNSYGCNAVLWAGQGPCVGVEMMELLSKLRVDFNIFNENGQGVLHKAAQRGKLDVCQWLMKANKLGSGVHLSKHFQPTKTEQSTPSELATYAGNEELARWLIEWEQDLNRTEELSFHVREGKQSDWQQIKAIYEETFLACHAPLLGGPKKANTWFDPTGHCLVATSSNNNSIVGFIFGVDACAEEVWTRGQPFIEDLFVSPRFHRLGIGQKLVRAMEKKLADNLEKKHDTVQYKERKWLTLCCLEVVSDAHQFYESLGFLHSPNESFVNHDFDGYVYRVYSKELGRA
jgi:ankyrin repeat protein